MTPAPAASVLWRRLDRPGHEWARLEPRATGWVLHGVALFPDEGQSCCLGYRIVCDDGWRTLSADVNGWVGARRVDCELVANPEREWTLNGQPVPAVSGCADVDLEFSPATNLLPLRRLPFAPGVRHPVRAAWLRFPSFALEPLEQSYTCLAPGLYLYESAGGSFQRELEVDDQGFVTHYPDFWQVEPD